MAEGALIFFIRKLYEFLAQKVHLITDARNEVILLHQKLEWLHCLLIDAEGKCKENQRAKVWVSQITDVVFEAEDIIDEYILQVEHQHSLRSGLLGCITKCYGTVQEPKVLYDIGKDINGINTRLQHIEDNKSKYGIEDIQIGVGGGREASSSSPREKVPPVVEELNVVGMEDEANTIAKLLMDGDDQRSIVSIVGMGGLGKTTLAKKVYNRRDLKGHFHSCAWIYVSQEFRVRELLFDILRCLIDREAINMMKDMNKEELSEQLHNCLKGKKYFLVIDDIWRIEAWNGLVGALPDDENGSRILLTTRNVEVAKQTDPRSIRHELRFLNEGESFELLCMKAFPNTPNHGCLPELEEVVREIAKKCGGLPLGAVVLGGLLSMKEQTRKEWKRVLDGIDWHLNKVEHQILGILALSYNDLPFDLKSCFLHIGSFPEDTEISARKLIQLWVVEGFVERKGNLKPEDVAEGFLLELVQRSMIQVVEKNYVGGIKKCRVHSLLRDLAIKEAKSLKFLEVFGDEDVVYASCTTARRLAITHHDMSKYICKNSSARHLRSLYCFTQYDEVLGKAELRSLYKNFKFLRVLHLEGVKVSMIPNEIGDLIYLRWLSFLIIYEENVRLSLKLSNLCNLQSLRVTFGKGLRHSIYIHEDTWKMKQLKHLQIPRGIFSKEVQQVQLKKLTNLQTLSLIRVGDWVKDDWSNLTGLRSLGLCGDITSYQIHLSNSISKLKNLEKLKLIGETENQISIPLHPLQELEKLHVSARLEKLPSVQEFPRNLAKIVLVFSKLLEDPFPILEQLPKLKILQLLGLSYLGMKLSSSATGFPKLEKLVISLIDFEEWTMEEGALANLKHLMIDNCLKLKMIPEGLQHVTTLQGLRLEYMPADFTARVKQDGEDWFKIRHIPDIFTSEW